MTKRLWILLGVLICSPVMASEFSSATKVGKPNTKVMGCPDGAFWDPRNGGECWTCPEGKRTLNPVTSAKACRVGLQTSFQPAKRLEANKNTCGDGSFLDVGKGTCWSCPSGTKRTAFAVDSDKACSSRVARRNRKATFEYKTKNLLTACRSGTFANVGSRDCYSCPKGWRHDKTKKVKTNGVCFKPAYTKYALATETEDFSLTCKAGFYDVIDGGSCWECPAGYVRQVTSVKSAKACMRVTKPQNLPAQKISNHSPTFKQMAVGVSKLGCEAHNKQAGAGRGNAFFDLKDGGSCWTCPTSHPQRTIYPVDTGKACATKACGSENGRPCYVWERVPSCNAGLIEDPIKGQCVAPANLACRSYVNTLKGLRDVMHEAQTRGAQAAEEAINKIPGAKAYARFALNQMEQVQKLADKAMPKIDYSAIVEPYTEFLQRDPEFIQNFLATVTFVAENQDKFANMMLDADLVCGGDATKLAQKFTQAGLTDVFKVPEPKRGPSVIKMSEVGYPLHPVAMGGAIPSAALISPVVGPGSRNRLILDFSMDISGDLFGIKGFKGAFSPGIQLAIALDSIAQGDHGVYLVFGGYAGGAAKTPKDIEGLIKDHLGAIHFSVGLQLGGPQKHANHGCHSSGIVSGGIAIKTKHMGFGFNPTCPLTAVFSGFNVNVGAMNLGELKTFTQTVAQVATGSGTVPVGQSPWTQPRFSKTYPTRQLLGGGELAIRLLPIRKEARIGSVF